MEDIIEMDNLLVTEATKPNRRDFVKQLTEKRTWKRTLGSVLCVLLALSAVGLLCWCVWIRLLIAQDVETGVTGRVTTYGGGLQTSSISTTSEPYPRNDSTSAENIRNVRSDSLSEAFIKRSLDWEIKARKLAVERVRLARLRSAREQMQKAKEQKVGAAVQDSIGRIAQSYSNLTDEDVEKAAEYSVLCKLGVNSSESELCVSNSTELPIFTEYNSTTTESTDTTANSTTAKSPPHDVPTLPDDDLPTPRPQDPAGGVPPVFPPPPPGLLGAAAGAAAGAVGVLVAAIPDHSTTELPTVTELSTVPNNSATELPTVTELSAVPNISATDLPAVASNLYETWLAVEYSKALNGSGLFLGVWEMPKQISMLEPAADSGSGGKPDADNQALTAFLEWVDDVWSEAAATLDPVEDAALQCLVNYRAARATRSILIPTAEEIRDAWRKLLVKARQELGNDKTA